MSMQEPLDIAQIEANAQANKQLVANNTYGVVAPNGVISEHFCPPPDKGKSEGEKTGDTVLRWINGRPQVEQRWADKGYVLYDDLAKQDGEPEKAALWKKAVSSRLMGFQVRGDVNKLYSKSVLERRAAYKAGSAQAGGKAFDIDAGGVVDDPEAARELMAKRIVETTGLDPKLVEAEEKAKAAKAGGKAGK